MALFVSKLLRDFIRNFINAGIIGGFKVDFFFFLKLKSGDFKPKKGIKCTLTPGQ